MLSLLAWTLLQVEHPPIKLLPTQGTKEEVDRSTKALIGRCAEYGYTGISAVIDPTPSDPKSKFRVSLKCQTGWTEEMIARVKTFSKLKGAELAFYRIRELTQVESEQFKDEKSAPPGAKWLPVVSITGDVLTYRLVYGEPVIKASEVIAPKLKGDATWDFTPAAAKRLNPHLADQQIKAAVDGLILDADWWVLESEESDSLGHSEHGPCKGCKGTGQRDYGCARCSGHGYVLVMDSAGRGIVPQRCASCNGGGRFNNLPCKSCGATGTVQCKDGAGCIGWNPRSNTVRAILKNPIDKVMFTLQE